MKLKTSTKLSLKFTLFATGILLFFSLVVLVFFFNTRASKQEQRLLLDGEYATPAILQMMNANRLGFLLKVVEERPAPMNTSPTPVPSSGASLFATPKDNNPIQEVSPRAIADKDGYFAFSFVPFISPEGRSVLYKNGQYFLSSKGQDRMRLVEITEFIYLQAELIQILLILDGCFIVLIFIISRYLVRSSLKNLRKLTTYAKNLNFECLNTLLYIDGPDNDEIKIIADSLNASLEKIHSQIQSLKDFTANASHELKTPLMMMNTEIDLAMKKQDAVERLPKIKQSLKRISALLDILTLITKLESGVKLEKEEVSLKDLAEENIEVIKDRIKQSTGEKKLSQGKISLTVTPPLTDVTVKANPALLSIVFKNLIENALTHAGPEVKVSVILDQHSFSVEDTGVGIAPDIQDKIFERFYQAEKSEDKANHSFGLGLYLVKKIVELHGWKLTVKSEVGKGSTFTIKF